MGIIYRANRAFSVLNQPQLSFTVDKGKRAERLREIMQKVTPSFDIIIRIYAKELRAIWQGFDFFLCMSKLHMASRTHRGEKIIRIPAGLRLAIRLIKIQHRVIGFNLKRFYLPVCLSNIEDAHRDILNGVVREEHVKDKLHLGIFQGISVNVGKQRHPKLRSINGAKLYLGRAGALS